MMGESTTNPPLVAAPITGVQPGGGYIVQLELAWGRLRRSCLRRFRPAYVRTMESKRQGQCPNCPHDVIDPRDLKYWRNVCGYSFRPEDDAFAWRSRIGFARMGMAELIFSSLLSIGLAKVVVLLALIGHPLFWVLLLPIGLFLAEVLYFFRDPERTTPPDADALISPADGTVTHVDEVDEPDFPGGRAFRISIFLSIFNVHVNRVPRNGRVTQIRYFPGAFLDARHPQCGVANEQLWLDMEETATRRQLRIKQISGKLARRIVCWLREGEEVKAGERYGMIKFGSRTEVYLPLDTPREVLVKVGDTVYGGSTVIVRFK